MGSLQERKGFIPLPASCLSQAIVDVSENMRAKIYSIFCKIGKLSAAFYKNIVLYQNLLFYQKCLLQVSTYFSAILNI